MEVDDEGHAGSSFEEDSDSTQIMAAYDAEGRPSDEQKVVDSEQDIGEDEPHKMTFDPSTEISDPSFGCWQNATNDGQDDVMGDNSVGGDVSSAINETFDLYENKFDSIKRRDRSSSKRSRGERHSGHKRRRSSSHDTRDASKSKNRRSPAGSHDRRSKRSERRGPKHDRHSDSRSPKQKSPRQDFTMEKYNSNELRVPNTQLSICPELSPNYVSLSGRYDDTSDDLNLLKDNIMTKEVTASTFDGHVEGLCNNKENAFSGERTDRQSNNTMSLNSTNLNSTTVVSKNSLEVTASRILPKVTVTSDDDAEDGEILEDGEIESDGEVGEMTTEGITPAPEVTPTLEPVTKHGKVELLSDKDERKEDGPMNKNVSPVVSEPHPPKRRRHRDNHKSDRESKRHGSSRSHGGHSKGDDSGHKSSHKRSPKIPNNPPGHDAAEGGVDPPIKRSPQKHKSHKSSHFYPSMEMYSSPPGPYDSPDASPPGPYDSPSDSDEDGGYRVKHSMMGLIDDDYIDPNAALGENQDIYASIPNKRARRQQNKGMSIFRQPKVKKFLKDIPIQDRPMCRFFMEGKCHKGMDCQFRHDFTPTRKRELCKYYMGGNCHKGMDCLFMHGDFPCKFYHTGSKCFQGSNCKFSHDPLNSETREILENALEPGYAIRDPIEKQPSLLGDPPANIKPDTGLSGANDDADKQTADNPPKTKKIPSLFDIEVPPPIRHSPNKSLLPPRPGFYNDMMGCSPGNAPLMPPCMPPPIGPPGPLNIPALGLQAAIGLLGQLAGVDRFPPPHLTTMPPPPLGAIPPMMGPTLNLSFPPPTLNPSLLGSPPVTQGDSGQGNTLSVNPPTSEQQPQQQQQHQQHQQHQQQPPLQESEQPPLHNQKIQTLSQLTALPQQLQQPTPQQQSALLPSPSSEAPSEGPAASSQADMPQGEADPTSTGNIANHLPPIQRELFKRIQMQQQHATVEDENSRPVDTAQTDDSWYSSDEEDTASGDTKPKNKLADLLKSINKNAATSASVTKAAPTFDIMQMISTIRKMSTQSTTATSSTLTQATAEIKSPSPSILSPPPSSSSDADDSFSGIPIHNHNLDLPYRLVEISSRYITRAYKFHPTLDLDDPRYKHDPRIARIRKFVAQNPLLKRQTSNPSPRIIPASMTRDPRSATARVPPTTDVPAVDESPPTRVSSHGDIDLRLVNSDARSSVRSADPRLVDPRSTVSPRVADPRSTDPRSTDPRSTDPRSTDPRSTDPRSAARLVRTESSNDVDLRTLPAATQHSEIRPVTDVTVAPPPLSVFLNPPSLLGPPPARFTPAVNAAALTDPPPILPLRPPIMSLNAQMGLPLTIPFPPPATDFNGPRPVVTNPPSFPVSDVPLGFPASQANSTHNHTIQKPPPRLDPRQDPRRQPTNQPSNQPTNQPMNQTLPPTKPTNSFGLRDKLNKRDFNKKPHYNNNNNQFNNQQQPPPSYFNSDRPNNNPDTSTDPRNCEQTAPLNTNSVDPRLSRVANDSPVPRDTNRSPSTIITSDIHLTENLDYINKQRDHDGARNSPHNPFNTNASRKETLEYSSPLGGGSEDLSNVSIFSNRRPHTLVSSAPPRNPIPVENPRNSPSLEIPRNRSPVENYCDTNNQKDRTQNETNNYPGMMVRDMVINPNDPPLKDLFKTFDPTASPFC